MSRLTCAGGRVEIIVGDCRDAMREMAAGSVQCCVTSPPYFGLRDYGCDGQIGLEATPSAYVETMVRVFREVRRVLAKDGTLWMNLGDSYAGSWGSQGRQGDTGQMAGRAVTGHRQKSAISAAQIATHPRRASQTGTIREPGVKPKDLYGMPWRVAFALQEDGWYLRQDIIWHKPNPMPESIHDRCTKAHEYLFLLSKSPRYFYDAEAIREPSGWNPAASKMPDGLATHEGGHGAFHRDGREKGRRSGNIARKPATDRGCPSDNVAGSVPWEGMNRNKRSVWTVATAPFSGAHFATYPPQLIEPCILAGCPHGGLVIDPFGGAGTTGLVAARHGRRAILCELNPDYAEITRRRIGEEWREVRPAGTEDAAGPLFNGAVE